MGTRDKNVLLAGRLPPDVALYDPPDLVMRHLSPDVRHRPIDASRARALVVAAVREELFGRLPGKMALNLVPDSLRRRFVEREIGELALFVRNDRLTVEARGASWLSPTPEVPLAIGWGNEIPRELLWARVHDRATGMSWLAATSHIDLAAVAQMTEAVRGQLAERVSQVDAAVLLGDLNTVADPDAFRVLLDAGWRDAHGSADLNQSPTFLGDLAGRLGRIDHILVARAAHAQEWRRLPNPGGELSDHLAVAATISLSA